MRTVPDSAEVIVSERGALIPVDMLDAFGIQPGDRVAVLRTTRGSLLIVPVAPDSVGPPSGAVRALSPPRPTGRSCGTSATVMMIALWGRGQPASLSEERRRYAAARRDDPDR